MDGISIKVLKYFETAAEFKTLAKDQWKNQVWNKICEVVPRCKILKVNVTAAFIQHCIESGHSLPTL